MFTRCPKCKEVHPLTASVLSRSTGLVQCGRCNRIFNALSFLSDDWHASRTFKPADSSGGDLPVLGGRRKRNVRKVSTAHHLEPAADSRTAGSGASATGEATPASIDSHGIDSGGSGSGGSGSGGDNPDKTGSAITGMVTTESAARIAASAAANPTSDGDGNGDGDLIVDDTDADQAPAPTSTRSGSQLWGLATLALLMITAINVGWTFRDRLLQQPVVHQWMLDNNWVATEKPKGMLKSPADIQLVSRDMHTHPTRTGILVLSVTFVNLAQQTQAFPVLRITLLDGGNQPIAQRRLQPVEYLRAGANIKAGLAPDVFLPILLELADPGERAVGFEIEFL